MIGITSSIRRRFDRTGIVLAGLCALHCVATILIVSALGVGSHFLLEPAIHRIGLVLALVVAAVAMGWGVLRHRQPAPFMTAMVGLVFMGGALVVPHGTGEAALTILGVTLVAWAHLLNLRSPSLRA
jgi:hypothetical protein